MLGPAWNDCTPAARCAWIDQLRGWAVLVMIEVHAVNVWLRQDLLPDWLNSANGLVAPSFILCAGFGLALSVFRADGSMSPLGPAARRLAVILLWAYALHSPSLRLADWTVFGTREEFRELCQIDVLQCIVVSLLILQGLARVLRRPMVFAAAALALAVGTALAAPLLWQPGVADGWWLPIRGFINGNPDRGVASLFPLFPWFAFAAAGAVLGVFYRHFRALSNNNAARWSESGWLAALAVGGGLLWLWGWLHAQGALAAAAFPANAAASSSNTTLASVAERLGWVCVIGAVLGWVERHRGRWPGPNVVQAVSRESLLVYVFHLCLIFGVLLAGPVRRFTGWEPHSLGWLGTLALTSVLIAINLMLAMVWQRVRTRQVLVRQISKFALFAVLGWFAVLGCFLAAGWLR
ncbi:MAG: heparan-alpha-glucosaminide N-acetyltransferase domain-containing protein [Verrucomicrobiota bacterium]